jgi:ribose transport system substrate-binding protein
MLRSGARVVIGPGMTLSPTPRGVPLPHPRRAENNGRVAANHTFLRASLAGVAVAGLVAAGCGASHRHPATATDPAVRQARADVGRGLASPAVYRGPAPGPRAQPGGLIVFVAGDLTNGGIAGAALGVQQAADVIGWRLQILDGEGTTAGQARALRAGLRLKPVGMVLGGFDAAAQKRALRRAGALGIPVVGWHAGTRPGGAPPGRQGTER